MIRYLTVLDREILYTPHRDKGTIQVRLLVDHHKHKYAYVTMSIKEVKARPVPVVLGRVYPFRLRQDRRIYWIPLWIPSHAERLLGLGTYSVDTIPFPRKGCPALDLTPYP